MTDEFWKRKSLREMNRDEWESLCDGCALCCLHKLEDEETSDIYFTDIACKQLDLASCRCTDYAARAKLVSTCLVLNAEDTDAFRWLPATCAYRLLSEDQALPEWHYLVSGDRQAVHTAGISAQSKNAQSENETSQWRVMQKLAD